MEGIVANVLRCVFFYLLQVLFLKRLSTGWEGYFYWNVLFYPLFILLLPFRTPRSLLLLIAFGFGLLVDMAYDSPGVHASALVFMAYMRDVIIKMDWMVPRDGYKITSNPTIRDLGLPWFLRYLSILLACHVLFYFTMEVFVPAQILEILQKSFFTYILSMVFILIYMLIFRPSQ